MRAPLLWQFQIQSPPKESIHFRQSQVLKNQGEYRKSRGCVTPPMDLGRLHDNTLRFWACAGPYGAKTFVIFGSFCLGQGKGGTPIRVVPLLRIIQYIEIYYKVKNYIQQIPYRQYIYQVGHPLLLAIVRLVLICKAMEICLIKNLSSRV